ncbi:cyclic nucleotide-gated cation channel subunit A [Trichonephila inaurata madagascariensis]|uniref:Cyclic nucleotide-gated cation channel subunit A n=1 Tax=Trichonephila inaurata madagascariensis TaxID=2747483 RepID=A0A8X7C6Y2_9ARAC|nr:cyclic nucleotide-gated cation channel subunit A [Trichonephila inaurata madagascariensis]
MYIVNRGRLQVVTDNGKTVLATLRAGSYFGEISVLNMGTAGNRRTASVKSVGYSDLFCLYKQDMWDVLKDYPAARVRLEAIAVKRLEKYKKEEDGKKMTPCIPIPPTTIMGRSRSTPGLVESRGKVPLEEMPMPEDDMQITSHSSGDPDSSASRVLCFGLDQCGSPRCPFEHVVHHAVLTLSDAVPVPAYAPNLDQQGWYTHPQSLPYVAAPAPLAPGREALMSEVKRLREKLVSLEADNTNMRIQLSQQQWDFESRLTGLELQLCTTTGATTSPSIPSPDENNQESII